jgi:hypothetical protein
MCGRFDQHRAHLFFETRPWERTWCLFGHATRQDLLLLDREVDRWETINAVVAHVRGLPVISQCWQLCSRCW